MIVIDAGQNDLEPPTGVDKDAWKAALAAVRAYCGWHIAPITTSTVRVRVEGDLIVLPSLNVTTVIDVALDGVSLTTGSWVLMPEPTIRLTRPVRCERPVVATVRFQHGYTELPADVASVVMSASSNGMAGSNVTQVGQVQFGSSGVLPGAGDAVRASAVTLDRFRLGPRP